MDGLRMENPMIWGYPHDLGNLHYDMFCIEKLTNLYIAVTAHGL
jgi:hypothetical protein